MERNELQVIDMADKSFVPFSRAEAERIVTAWRDTTIGHITHFLVEKAIEKHKEDCQMSLIHKQVHRINDEYLCTHCGKSWDIDDIDPPSCSEVPTGAIISPTGRTNKGEPEQQYFRHTGTSYGSCGPFKGAPQNLPHTNLSELESRVNAELYRFNNDPAPGVVAFAVLVYKALRFCVGYASDEESMLKLASATLRVPAREITLRRWERADVFSRGNSAYMEMNPKHIEKLQHCGPWAIGFDCVTVTQFWKERP